MGPRSEWEPEITMGVGRARGKANGRERAVEALRRGRLRARRRSRAEHACRGVWKKDLEARRPVPRVSQISGARELP